MTTKQEIEQEISAARSALAKAELALESFMAVAKNNVFDDLETAVGKIEAILYQRADEDCEGSHNCGDESYTQGFYVGDVEYVMTGTFEYNRHDKTYYYIESSEFEYKIVE